MKSLTLEFKHLPYPHDAIALSNILIETIKNLKLESKTIAITTDNDASNIPAVNRLQNSLDSSLNSNIGFTLVRCIAHVINLGVKQALN